MEINKLRYEDMKYQFAGKSGVRLSRVSLGFWHNFGDENDYEKVKEMVVYAFNHGITHFDLANNYGIPSGSAEKNFGRIIKEELSEYRDQMFISTKAGYYMWPGPYGDGGSRKYLLSSLNQSLKRLGLDYVDLFYSHRYDSNTPLEETMMALVDAVKMGKALYVGLSNYPPKELEEAIHILKAHDVKPLLFQPSYSLINQRNKESGAFDVCINEGVGIIPFSIFSQGLLTGKYLQGIPKGSRMDRGDNPFLTKDALTDETVAKLWKIHDVAEKNNISMSELSLRYVLSTKGISTSLIGVSRLSQLEELIEIAKKDNLDEKIMKELESIVGE